jgi:hypothetical protein
MRGRLCEYGPESCTNSQSTVNDERNEIKKVEAKKVRYKVPTIKVPNNKIPNNKVPNNKVLHRIPNHKIPNRKKFLILNNRHCGFLQHILPDKIEKTLYATIYIS